MYLCDALVLLCPAYQAPVDWCWTYALVAAGERGLGGLQTKQFAVNNEVSVKLGCMRQSGNLLSLHVQLGSVYLVGCVAGQECGRHCANRCRTTGLPVKESTCWSIQTLVRWYLSQAASPWRESQISRARSTTTWQGLAVATCFRSQGGRQPSVDF